MVVVCCYWGYCIISTFLLGEGDEVCGGDNGDYIGFSTLAINRGVRHVVLQRGIRTIPFDWWCVDAVWQLD